ncbi:MrdA protein [Candidatus Moduliflexus flocculans]|uniref:MrdA protein n=1 Tax=Candidatus Moduliflexus flocculans TaxID=1499966 RepID=A0A0S6VWY5_9BACT|nr:MrdA protein [Candidatus Moduliflexus flocculans]
MHQQFHQRSSIIVKFRLGVYIGVVLLLFAVLVGRLWYLQIIQGEQFLKKSEENRIRLLRIRAPRGIISDADGFALVRNRPSFNVYLIREDVPLKKGGKTQDFETIAAHLDELLPISKDEILDKINKSTRPKFEPTLIFRDASLKTVAYLEEHKIELPGVMVDVEPLRYSIYDSGVCHVVGYLGEINEKELKDTLNNPDAVQGDLVGKSGIEQTFNLYLSGKPGGKQIEVNAHGRELETISQKNPMPGNNIMLTLNLHIQLIAEEALGDKIGAIVAVDPRNGHILAMVSHPGFNPNFFAGGISSDNWKSLVKNPDKPLQNKAIQSHYAPGSTFKPMIGSALLQNRIVSSTSASFCGGQFSAANTTKRCWKTGGHGYLNIKQAIEQSCNVFFYRNGLELGIDELARYAMSFGLGAKSGIELPNEVPGLIPTREWKQETIGDKWYPTETMDAAIGQGFVAVTPLQLAMMTSVIANGGTLYKPQIVKKIVRPNGEILKEYEPTVVRKVPIDEKHFKTIREGMWMVVNGTKGTARGSQLKTFQFAGKTGTAQVVKLQRGSQEGLPEKFRDHGWFICFAPAEKPEIAMAIIVEHGMGGAKAAAPVAKYIFERLFTPQELLVEQPVMEPTELDTLED